MLYLSQPPPVHVRSAVWWKGRKGSGRFVMGRHGGKGHRLLIQQREQKPELGASWEFHHQPGERKREQERGGGAKWESKKETRQWERAQE